MPRFAANLSMLFTEHDFLDRFAAAADAGFQAVEIQFPYEHPAAEVARRLAANRLELVLFNLPPGDLAQGERGLAALPGREAEFARSLETALDYARATGCRRLHGMAGVPGPEIERAAAEESYRTNLGRAAARLADHGITLLIEPINSRDMPGYLLATPDAARSVIAAVAAPNLALQFDLYHCQIMTGDVTTQLRRHIGITRHIQIAGVPDRQEPDRSELDYRYLFEVIDALGYDGWIGCEYRPRAGTLVGLGWVRPWLGRPAGEPR